MIDRLVKAYNGVVAVRNLSFAVEPGRITGFLGPNGAGKTTTLRILVGLVSPTTGSATFGGTAYADLNRPQETVGAVLDANFHPAGPGATISGCWPPRRAWPTGGSTSCWTGWG